MRKTDFSKALKLSVIFVLIAAMALCMISCADKTDSETEGPEASGNTVAVITVTVVNDKGESTEHIVKTDADNLGDALMEAGIIEGEEGPYGLYIKSVNGLRADYDLDGAYWALSKDGEYLMTGADATPIADGEHYELTYTK